LKSSVIQSNVYVNDQIVNTIQDLEPYTLYVAECGNPFYSHYSFSGSNIILIFS